jgi:hypothetical protein
VKDFYLILFGLFYQNPGNYMPIKAMPGCFVVYLFCSAGDGTQSLVHARQELSQFLND